MEYSGHYLFRGLYLDICVQWNPTAMTYNVTWTRSAERARAVGISETISAERTVQTVQTLIANREWVQKYPDHVQLPVGV